MTAVQLVRSIEGLGSFGDYSPAAHAHVEGGLVAIAGQFATDGRGEFRYGAAAEEQARGAFESVGVALRAVGLGFEDVLKFTTYVVGRETIPAFMQARKQVFADIYPAGNYPPNTLLVVNGLVEERFVIEIEALAVRRLGAPSGSGAPRG